MDAIMLALVAVLLANADGRTGRLLSQVMAARGDRRAVVAIAFAAFIANATIAAVAGTAANRMIGQGIVALLLAFALLGAAVALVWRGRLGPAVQSLEEAPLPLLAPRLFLAQLGDRSHFLIGALAATSGAGLWAAAGADRLDALAGPLPRLWRRARRSGRGTDRPLDERRDPHAMGPQRRDARLRSLTENPIMALGDRFYRSQHRTGFMGRFAAAAL